MDTTPSLPHDIDAERALLAAILLDNSLVEKITAEVQPEDFYVSSHRNIYKSMASLASQSMVIDAVTLSADLNARGLLDAVGGITALGALIDGNGVPSSWPHYARIVRKHARHRKLIREKQDELNALIEGDLPDDDEPDTSQSNGAAPKSNSLFKTYREMRETCEKVYWLAAGYIAVGAVTELIGRVKEGKTTLILSLVHACLTGGRWLERQIRKQPVIYLTEQPRVSFISQMQQAGPLSPEEAENLHVLSYSYVRGKKLPDLIVAAEKLAKQIGAKLIIIDSFGRFAGFLGDSENNSGTGQQAMDVLVWAASRGLAPVSLRHASKGNGRDVQDAGRGSSAISGSADILIQLKRLEGNQDDTLRELAAVGRFDAIPERVTIRYDKGTGEYELLGETQAVRRDTAKEAILRALPGDADSALTEAEIVSETRGSRSTVQRVLKELLKSGEAQKTGSGKRGDPIRYYAEFEITIEDDDEENVSAQTSGGLGRKKPTESDTDGQKQGDATEKVSAQYKKGGLGRNQSENPDRPGSETLPLTAPNSNSESGDKKGFCPNPPPINGQKENGSRPDDPTHLRLVHGGEESDGCADCGGTLDRPDKVLCSFCEMTKDVFVAEAAAGEEAG